MFLNFAGAISRVLIFLRMKALYLQLKPLFGTNFRWFLFFGLYRARFFEAKIKLPIKKNIPLS